MQNLNKPRLSTKGKNIIALLLLIIVVVVLVYVFGTYLQFRDSGLTAEAFTDVTYISLDDKTSLIFKDNGAAELITPEGRKTYLWTYEESVIRLTEKRYIFKPDY